MQYQLDTCASIQDVLASDKLVRIDTDEYKSHFFVCDASGACATIEWFQGRLRACAGGDVKIQAMTNSPYAECLARGDDPSGRFGRAARMLDAYAGGDPVGHVFSILHAVSQPSTVWSLVFDVEHRRLYYRTARNPEIRSVCLKDFDPSCAAPVRMLDVNGPGKNDVGALFRDFTPEENARVVRPALEKWRARNPAFTDRELDETLEYYKTLRCETE
jgi:choloylglycine hydrolase